MNRPARRWTRSAILSAWLVAAALGLILGAAAPAFAASEGWNTGWRFHRVDSGPVPDPSALPPQAWEPVGLPHIARIEPRLSHAAWQGTAFYQKTFPTARTWAGQDVYLRIEAAMNVATVSLNGQVLTHHLGGYTPFTVDLTPALKAKGDNVLLVTINNEDNPVTGPKPHKDLDFVMYAGLYRGVELIVKPPVHITDEMLADTPAGGGVFVTYPKAEADQAIIAVQTQLENATDTAQSVALTQTLARAGRTVGQARQTVTLAPHQVRSVAQQITLARPALWSPDQPNLYDLTTRATSGLGADQVENRIGVRRYQITKGQLLINGRAYSLMGVNRHQEYPYVGYALSDQANYRDALLIKQAGFDYVRLSHYPQSPAFMVAADQLGVAVLDAIPGWQYFNPDPAFRAQVLKTCADMIRRDRNHPSVLAWECSLNETGMPDDLMAAFHQTVHAEYPGDQAWSAGWELPHYDIYLQARQHRLGHEAVIDKPLIVSEYGDWEYYAQNAGFNQTAWSDLKPEARTSRQLLSDGEARLRQQVANIAEAHNDDLGTPAIADGYWVMFDYNRGYADDLESSGVMSLERRPKFAFDFFRSQRDASQASPVWGGGPMVFIASYWDPASSPKIAVYSNADEVELFLNGASLGRHKPDRTAASSRLKHPPFSFDAPAFTPGTLTAKAYIDGRPVASDTVRTPGVPARLKVWLDDLGVKPVADDLVFARAQLIDADGVPLHTSGAPVGFTAAGGYQIVGADIATTEAGVASVLIKVTDPGHGRLQAESAGVAAGTAR